MIKKYKLGETSYGGEVYALEADELFEIPALRCFLVDSNVYGKNKSLEDAIEHINKNQLEAKKTVAKFYEKDASIGETAREAVYLKGVSRLLSFLSWMPVGAPRGIQGIITERHVDTMKEINFVDIGNETLKAFFEDLKEIYGSLYRQGYEAKDLEYILPLAVKTEIIVQLPVGRELDKWANYLSSLYLKNNKTFSLCLKELNEVGKYVKKWNVEKSGLDTNEKPSDDSYMKLMIRDTTRLRNYLFVMFNKSYYYPKKDIMSCYFPTSDTLIFRVPASIANFYYEVRNRQEQILWPSWEEVIYQERHVMPDGLKKSRRGTLSHIYRSIHDLGKNLWEYVEKEPAIYAQPMGKEIDAISLIHGSENAIKTFRLNTSVHTQPELRLRFINIAEYIESSFGDKLLPNENKKSKKKR